MWFIFFCAHLSRARVGVKITFFKISLFSIPVPTVAQTKLVIKEKGIFIFFMRFRIPQRKILKKSGLFFTPLKFLFVELEIHCFLTSLAHRVPWSLKVCIGEYLNLNKTITSIKLKTDSSFPPAQMLCKILVTSSPQTKI